MRQSFGCPTFINFGRNNEGAPDDFVCTVSPDADDAYTPADAFVLARATKDELRSRVAREFFAGLDQSGRGPRWTRDVAGRAPVLQRPGRCSRSGITYVPALRRYLWVVTLPSKQEPGKVWSGLV